MVVLCGCFARVIMVVWWCRGGVLDGGVMMVMLIMVVRWWCYGGVRAVLRWCYGDVAVVVWWRYGCVWWCDGGVVVA